MMEHLEDPHLEDLRRLVKRQRVSENAAVNASLILTACPSVPKNHKHSRGRTTIDVGGSLFDGDGSSSCAATSNNHYQSILSAHNSINKTTKCTDTTKNNGVGFTERTPFAERTSFAEPTSSVESTSFAEPTSSVESTLLTSNSTSFGRRSSSSSSSDKSPPQQQQKQQQPTLSFIDRIQIAVEDDNVPLLQWMPGNDNAFTIVDTTKFAKTDLPKLFEIQNMSSFIRKLTRVGFKRRYDKVTMNFDIFEHPDLIRHGSCGGSNEQQQQQQQSQVREQDQQQQLTITTSSDSNGPSSLPLSVLTKDYHRSIHGSTPVRPIHHNKDRIDTGASTAILHVVSSEKPQNRKGTMFPMLPPPMMPRRIPGTTSLSSQKPRNCNGMMSPMIPPPMIPQRIPETTSMSSQKRKTHNRMMFPLMPPPRMPTPSQLPGLSALSCQMSPTPPTVDIDAGMKPSAVSWTEGTTNNVGRKALSMMMTPMTTNDVNHTTKNNTNKTMNDEDESSIASKSLNDESNNANQSMNDELNSASKSMDADRRWKKMYKKLNAYKTQHGDCLVPVKYADDPSLGIWVQYQRQRKKKDELSTERINKLEGVGFIWKVDRDLSLVPPLKTRKEDIQQLKIKSSNEGKPHLLAQYVSSYGLAYDSATIRAERTLQLLDEASKVFPIGNKFDPSQSIRACGISSLVQCAFDKIETQFRSNDFLRPNESKTSFLSTMKEKLLEQYDSFAPTAIGALMDLSYGNIHVGSLLLAFTDGCFRYERGAFQINHCLRDVKVVYNSLCSAYQMRDQVGGNDRAMAKTPTIGVRITFGLENAATKSIYSQVKPDEQEGPSIEYMEELGRNVYTLAKKIQQHVKDDNDGLPASHEFLSEAVNSGGFEGSELALLDSVLDYRNQSDPKYKVMYDHLSLGKIYAKADGCCSAWWTFAAVLFHLGCSKYIIYVFNSFFGDLYFTLIRVLFGSHAALVIRIWWIVLWAGFDGSILHYETPSHCGRIVLILPEGDIQRWFYDTVFKPAFPDIHCKPYTQKSKTGGKDLTCLTVYRKKEVGKIARMILWALSFDGTEWGMKQPQNISKFIPPKKLEALQKLKLFGDPMASVGDADAGDSVDDKCIDEWMEDYMKNYMKNRMMNHMDDCVDD